MNWLKQILIVALAVICFGCQETAKEVERPQVSMEEEIRKIEAAALTEKTVSKTEEKTPAAEAAPVAANQTIEKLNRLLAEVAMYDYDKSRVALSEASELIRNASGEDKKLIEKRLDEFLKSGVTLAGKDFVCRELSLIGTEVSAAALAPMLTDANTTDMARYALERIQGEAVDDALVNSLGKTGGRVKVGIVNTLGERHNPKSVFALAGLIYDEDAAAASAAVTAIGKIGGLQAANILAGAKGRTPVNRVELRNLILDAYLNCANQFAAKGDRVQAIVIFQRLYDSNEPVQFRIAALRGIVTSTGGQEAGILAGALKSNEPAIQSAAIVLVREVPAEEILKTAVAELPNLGAVAKMQMLTALADCGYKAAMPAAIAAVNDENAEVRLAVLKTIGKLGGASDVQLLTERAAAASSDERQVARESLYLLRGADIDKAILAAMEGASPKIKVELIQAIGERNITSAADCLLITAKETDPRVRVESLKALRIVGGPGHLVAIIELLKAAPSQAEAKEFEKTVAAAANKISDANQRANAIIAAMETVPNTEVKSSFINILGRIGTSSALSAVRSAMQDKNERIREAAIRTLSDWPNAEPMEDLLQVAQNSTNNIHKVLALRGYIRLVGLESQRPAEETIKLYMQAMALAPNINEKRMVLAGISSVKSYSAIEAAAGFLSDEQLGAEAAGAIIQIAKRTRGEDNPEQTKAALKRVIETVKTEQLRKQAEEALSKIK